ncbi:hypothetical protein CVT25_014512 [Psilocybe cyanescens]|uniref:Uncharacterized protein n=1 Tax=Psilocybe cyanescens TaxID=93625 RepID=A0A409X939_PSICY|nr:hypothetical protein CVT25_014512 [Psilocybe cyanescens]
MTQKRVWTMSEKTGDHNKKPNGRGRQQQQRWAQPLQPYPGSSPGHSKGEVKAQRADNNDDDKGQTMTMTTPYPGSSSGNGEGEVKAQRAADDNNNNNKEQMTTTVTKGRRRQWTQPLQPYPESSPGDGEGEVKADEEERQRQSSSTLQPYPGSSPEDSEGQGMWRIDDDDNTEKNPNSDAKWSFKMGYSPGISGLLAVAGGDPRDCSPGMATK